MNKCKHKFEMRNIKLISYGSKKKNHEFYEVVYVCKKCGELNETIFVNKPIYNIIH